MRVSVEIVTDYIVDALESGLTQTSWLDTDSDSTIEEVLDMGYTMSIHELEEDEDNSIIDTYHVDRTTFDEGITLFASKNPKHVADLISGNYDFLTGQLMWQYILFGEERYA